MTDEGPELRTFAVGTNFSSSEVCEICCHGGDWYDPDGGNVYAYRRVHRHAMDGCRGCDVPRADIFSGISASLTLLLPVHKVKCKMALVRRRCAAPLHIRLCAPCWRRPRLGTDWCPSSLLTLLMQHILLGDRTILPRVAPPGSDCD